jgi:hypothetical protein
MLLSLREYHARVARVREAVGSQVAAVWLGLGAYRDANVDRFVRVAVPKVQAGQISTARLTAQFLGGPVLSRDAIVAVRPVAQVLEYRRPAVKLYTLLSQGVAFADALRRATALVGDLTATDMQLALRAQSQASLSAGGYTQYRRVLTGSENCARCAIAASNVYSTRDLLPIHDHCDCTVEPIRDELPSMDFSGLELTGARAEQVAGGASYESLVTVHEHGELGPVIAWASDAFTGPSDIAA